MHRKKIQNFLDSFFNFFDKYPREYFIFAFFALFILAILKETFSYTVLHYDFYNELAYKQQVGKVEIPVTRGTIYSATENGTVFSTSVDLNDLAIDPKIE
jgi:cell division protein FtsI/penicillin-binding protein 2